METRGFMVTSSPVGSDTAYVWRASRPQSLARRVAVVALPAVVSGLLMKAGLPFPIAVGVFMFACMGAYVIPNEDRIEFDFMAEHIDLPGSDRLPFRDLVAVRLEFLPMDLRHDWTSVSVLLVTTARRVRLDLVCQEIVPVEAFVRRICGAATCTFTRERMDVDRACQVLNRVVGEAVVD